MHDDEQPLEQEPVEPERHWTEAEWERFMLDNERLMDRYQRVWEEHPKKSWKDPLDLYYKVHYDLDAPEESEKEGGETPASTEPAPGDESQEAVSDGQDDVHGIPAYQSAYAFATMALDYVRQDGSEPGGPHPLREQLCLHALRIAADIAGGHGLGYEEDTLCGNIVKNRWALGHAKEAQRLLRLLAEREGSTPTSEALLSQLPPLINALEERIVELRAKVWWDT
jgi:hypothetical protein